MKAKELRLMNESDMGNKMMEMKKELMKINSQIAIGTIPKNPDKVKNIKRTMAQIFTIRNQKIKGGNKKE